MAISQIKFQNKNTSPKVPCNHFFIKRGGYLTCIYCGDCKKRPPEIKANYITPYKQHSGGIPKHVGSLGRTEYSYFDTEDLSSNDIWTLRKYERLRELNYKTLPSFLTTTTIWNYNHFLTHLHYPIWVTREISRLYLKLYERGKTAKRKARQVLCFCTEAVLMKHKIPYFRNELINYYQLSKKEYTSHFSNKFRLIQKFSEYRMIPINLEMLENKLFYLFNRLRIPIKIYLKTKPILPYFFKYSVAENGFLAGLTYLVSEKFKLGFSQRLISKLVGCSKATLRKTYQEIKVKIE